MKQRVVIFLFFFLNVSIAGLSLFYDFKFEIENNTGEKSEEISESFFKTIHYFSMNAENPTVDLTASELIINEDSKDLTFFDPKGISFGADGLKVNFDSQLGSFKNKQEKLELRKEAHLYTDEMDLKCEKALFFVDQNKAQCFENVQTNSKSKKTGDELKVFSDEMEAYPDRELTTYSGSVVGEVKRKRKYEHPINFKSDIARIDLTQSIVNLNKNVWLKQMGVSATSQRGEIYLENYNKKLKYFVLYDDVNVKEKVVTQGPDGDKEFIRRALSEKLEGITSDEMLVLTGYPKVYQLDDVIRGNRIILRRDSELVEVEDANTLFFLKEQNKQGSNRKNEKKK